MNAQDLTVRTTAIDGLLLVELPVHGDNRGWFKENWQRARAVAAGLPDASFVQHNISFNGSRGTTRGIHAEPWDKYVSVATGRVFGAWVDLREGPGFGTVVTHELTPGTAVFVPRGVGNAFQTLEEATAYSYLVTDHWRADATAEYSFVNLGDPELGIAWPVPLADAELSAKDRAHPPLDDVAPLAPAPVLVLGAHGQVGLALTARLSKLGVPFTAWTRAELDLANPAAWPAEIRSGDALRRYRAVVNAAAFTAVDDAETPESRATAWAVNATGVGALAAACARAGTTLVHFSTDYVFDGALPLDAAYAPDHPVAPLSVYGQSKAAGETARADVPAALRGAHQLGDRAGEELRGHHGETGGTWDRPPGGGGPARSPHRGGGSGGGHPAPRGHRRPVRHVPPHGFRGALHVGGCGPLGLRGPRVRPGPGHTDQHGRVRGGDEGYGAPRPVNSELEIASVLDAGFTPQDSRAVARQEAAAFGGRHPSNGSKG